MPSLHRMWKEKVLNHHHEVPYKVLEKQYIFGDEKNENKIIHGDNLEALKSLLPQYEGKIKCIYIDPPYNTWNEGWVYNDNVNHPKIKKWLHQVVGKEWEDLSRHDKWLCMMYPRLKLLHKLLKEDGVIFISIDDNEQANLKLMMDEIFWTWNFITNIIRQKKYTQSNDAKYFSNTHDFILCYAKNTDSDFRIWLIERTTEQNDRYKNIDNDSNWPWMTQPLHAKSWTDVNFEYTFKNWITRKPPVWTYPRYNKETLKRAEDEWKIWFWSNWTAVPRLKKYLNEMKEWVIPKSIWLYDEGWSNDDAKRDIKSIFNDNYFETPKPVKLIDRILKITTDKSSIVLDSFSWSWTTAHAVLNLNKQDWWDRKFILIEMEDYAKTITAERVKRVVKWYWEESKKVEWTGWGFSYYELGQSLFLDEENLNEAVGEDKLKEYIWYTETKTSFTEPKKKNKYFLGTNHDADFYFFYEKNNATTLNHEFLSSLETKKNKQFVIYADMCLLSEEFMRKHNIIFKKIPRDITKF